MNIDRFLASEAPSERSQWKNVYRPAIVGTLVVSSIIGIAAAVDRQDPESTFKRTFAAEGECLSGTPFDPNDPDGNTRIIVDDSKGYDALLVWPQAPNYTEPSVLVFNISDGEGIFAPPVFSDSDTVTGVYISGLDGCPPLPQQ